MIPPAPPPFLPPGFAGPAEGDGRVKFFLPESRCRAFPGIGKVVVFRPAGPRRRSVGNVRKKTAFSKNRAL